jgi:uncharacterized protein with PQ loop repeat
MEFITLIGWAATAVSASRSVPQLVRTIRTRDVTGLTPATPGCSAVSAVAWASYALTVGNTALLATSLLTAVGAAVLAVAVAVLGGMPPWSQRVIVLWGVLLMVIASIGGAPVLVGVLTVAVMVNAAPQVRAVIANPSASGVSVTAWAVAAVEAVLWCSYGIAANSLSLALWGFCALLPTVVVLVVVVPERVRYRRTERWFAAHPAMALDV